MKQESKKITLPLGDVSLSSELGQYYIDMRPAIVHYTKNIYGGKFDDDGVPMIKNSNGQLEYTAINIAQYGFMLLSDYHEKKDAETLQKLKNCLSVLENIKTQNDETVAWYHNSRCEKYYISPPWASAMAQGEAISFYLRMYQIIGNESLLQTAKYAYNFLKIECSDGGVRRYDENNDLWFEEYPSNPPSYVLNGFIYTILGLYDLYRVTKSEEVKNDINLSIQTLRHNLPKFDVGYWSIYDMQRKELVRYYYQKNVHVPQLNILYILTHEAIFKKYADKWLKTVNPINYLFVELMYRIRPRLQKLCKKK